MRARPFPLAAILPALVVALGVAPLVAAPLRAQEAARETAPPALVRTIVALDSVFFDAYNRCDLETFARLLDPAVEFYHDQGGPSVGAAPLVEGVRNNICGKVTRQVVPGSTQVFVMKGYGAIQSGAHRFFPYGQESRGAQGEARYFHLWKQDGATWRLVRIFSYDHRPLP